MLETVCNGQTDPCIDCDCHVRTSIGNANLITFNSGNQCQTCDMFEMDGIVQPSFSRFFSLT